MSPGRRGAALMGLAVLVLGVNVVLGRTVDRWSEDGSIGSGMVLLLALGLFVTGVAQALKD